MLHQDGSRHVWLAGLPAMDLIVTMDDATSEIYSAFLVAEEGTASTFQALAEVIGVHGLPLSLYTDRGSHYFLTPEAGGPVDRTRLTQVGRALDRLGIEHIAAYSPEARGRSERMFRTLQDRLVKELALAGIATVEAANRFIRAVYLPAHNARFTVKPEQDGTAFVPVPGLDLNEILCVQEDRQVGNDNTVIFQRLRLQIPPSPLRPHFVKLRVRSGNTMTARTPSFTAHAASAATVPPADRSTVTDPSRDLVRPQPSTASHRAQCRQGRCAVALRAIYDRPSARRVRNRRVGSGQWS